MNNRVVYTQPESRKINKRYPRAGGKRKKMLGIILAILLSCVIIVGIVYLIRRPKLQIKRIEFSGLTALNEAELKDRIAGHLDGNLFLILPKSFYFFVKPQALAAWLKNEFPPIGEVTVKKHLPDSLRVEVSERNLFGVLCQRQDPQDGARSKASKCVFVDKDGMAYEEAPHTEGSLIRKIEIDKVELKIGSKILDPELLGRLEEINSGVKLLTGSAITGFQLFSKTPNEIWALSSQGYKIYFNARDDFKNSFRVLKTVLEKEIKDKIGRLDYVDLRFGNKVFYKFKP